MQKLFGFLLIFILLGAISVPLSTAQDNAGESSGKEEKAGQKENKDKQEDEGDKKKKETYIKDKVKDFETSSGLFILYQNPKDGETYLEIKKEQLGKEYIYFSHVQEGVVGAFHFRGQYRGSKIFTIKKHFNKLEFIAENTSYYFDEESALSRAKDANISHAVLASEKIEANDSLETAYLIKADALFLSEDVAPVKPVYPKKYKGYKLGKLSKDKTKYVGIKNYPENTDVVVEYVYENKSPDKSAGAGATDSRFVSTRVQHSWIAVPNNDYVPRADDPRVGYFMRQITDLTSYSATPYKDVINRWHLKKKNPGAKLSEPVTPIVWWMENTTPKEIRGTIKKAVLGWNKAFEKAGFKNAIQVKVQPDDADWDAGDIRYNVLRWTSSPRARFGGYGPSFVNPRTGQILGADIMLEFVFLTNRVNYNNIFSSAALDVESPEFFGDESRYCMLQNHLQMSNMFGLMTAAILGSDDITKKQLVKESIYYLMLHEVGHTFGLNHNMRASQMLSPKQVTNKGLTKKKGLTGSVMDYPAINVTGDKRKQGQFYTTHTGPYDLWAIEYGYSPAEKSSKKEAKRLSRILARSTEPDLAFGNDADDMRSAGKALDPRVNIYDMSSDAITYAVERIELSKKVTGEMLKKFRKENQSYQELRNAYFISTREHALSLGVISRYIGGVYVDRAFEGQSGATKPFRPVPVAEQKRAMEALAKHAFAPDAFDLPSDLFNYLQSQRRGFNHRRNPEDPKIHERVLNMQTRVLDHLLHKNVMARITNTNLYGNGYSLAQVMDDLTDSIFNTDLNTSVNDFRKNLQTEYIKNLVKIMGEEGKSSHDNISQTLAYFHLKEISKKLSIANSPDRGTEAHRTYLVDMIKARFEVM